MFKKIFALILVFLMLLPSLVACRNEHPNEAETTTTDLSEYTTDIIQPSDTPMEKYSAIEFLRYELNGDTLALTSEVTSNEASEFSVTFEHNGADKKVLDVTLTNGSAVNSFTFDGLTDGEHSFDFVLSLKDGTVLQNATIKFKSKLPQLTKDGVRLVVSAMTNEEKASMVVGEYGDLKGYTGLTAAVERLGVPSIKLNDGPAGVRKSDSATWLPSETVLASSWDTSILNRIGYIAGEECIIDGVDILLAPGMNIQRSVLNGRNFEYYSEDPLLTGYMATAMVNGVQKTGVGTAIKHFAVNNQETGRTTVTAELSERALREIYLRGFAYSVQNSAPYTVMSSYNRINGTYTSINKDLLSILRDEFGFSGFVMSDWNASGESPLMVEAGNDIFMPGDADHYNAVLTALNNKSLSQEAIDTAIANILSVIVKTNTFNGAPIEPTGYNEHATAVREAAEQSMVLLKNENALPTSGEVALFGEGSYQTLFGGGGSGTMRTTDGVNINEGIESHGKFTLTSSVKSKYLTLGAVTFTQSELAQAAESASVAIVTIQRSTTETLDHSTAKGDWQLSDKEHRLLENISSAFHAKGKKVVVLLNCGNPIETNSWASLADAILFVGYSGEETGNAVANILSGDVTPSGKTAVTWPLTYESTPAADHFGFAQVTHYYEDIYVGYRFYSTFDVDVSYPFGYGLSYTNFEYSDFQVSRSSFDSTNDILTLSVKVKNIGSVSGRDVVQFYVSKPDGANEQAKYDLCGFGKTALLAPGASETVEIKVTADELKTYIESRSDWVIEKGEYTFSVAASVEDIKASAAVNVTSDILVDDVTNKCQNASELKFLTKADKESFTASKPQDLTQYASATGSDDEGGKYPAKNAVDGLRDTRWSAYNSSKGARVLTVDLGGNYFIGHINIAWESNSAMEYLVQTSVNGIDWSVLDNYNMPALGGLMKHEVSDLKARFIKITVPSSSRYCSIYEVSVGGPLGLTQTLNVIEKKENLALNAIASANFQQTTYSPINVCDGLYTTRWSGYGCSTATEVLLDLGSVNKLGESEILWEANRTRKFSVYTSVDGKRFTLFRDFTIASSVSDTNYKAAFDFAGVEAQYVKLTIPHTTSYVSVYEWEIWEK